MIDSIFLLSGLGEILIEKHYRAGTPRSAISDLFWDRATGARKRGEVHHHIGGSDDQQDEEDDEEETALPVVDLGNGRFAVHIKRGDLTIVAALSHESQPLMIIEFLHRFADILTVYLGSPDEVKVKDAFSTVYQLLDEVMDGGFPLVTEPNALKEMIAPPSFLNKFAASVVGTSTVTPVLAQSTSGAPWRKKDITYTQNEIFLDVEEEVNAIIGANGIPLSVDLGGIIVITSRLSRMPQVVCRFDDPSILHDVAFHPCVDVDRWERDRLLVFIPPDGTFELLRYRVSKSIIGHVMHQPIAPVYCNVIVAMPPRVSPVAAAASSSPTTTTTTSAKIEIVVGSRPNSEPTEQVCVRLPLPSTSRFLGAKSHEGSVTFNDRTCTWRIGSFTASKPAARLTGSFTVSNEQAGSIVTALLEFSCVSKPLSGLRVASLEITNESYSFFKGVKTVLKSGEFQIRG